MGGVRSFSFQNYRRRIDQFNCDHYVVDHGQPTSRFLPVVMMQFFDCFFFFLPFFFLLLEVWT